VKYNKMSRRFFLQGTGGYLLSAPLLHSLLPSNAFAQVSSPKRLIGVMTRNGTHHPAWYPTIGPLTLVAPNVRERTLTGTAGSISQILGSSFDSLKSKLLLVRGLDGLYFDGHNSAGMWGANAGDGEGSYNSRNITIDHILAQSAKFYSTEPKFRTLSLAGTNRGPNFSFFKSGGLVTKSPAIYDPRAVFEKLFGETAGLSEAQIARMKAQKKSVVDFVLADLDKTMKGTKIGADDRKILDSHVTSIRDVERKIQNISLDGGSCGSLTPPASITASNIMYDGPTELSHSAYISSLIDLIVVAIKCDMTRIVSLMLSDSSALYGFLGVSDGHHTISHGGSARYENEATLIDQYHAKKFAELLAKLDVPEDSVSGKTYLDNSIVMWGHEFAGMVIRNHRQDDLPVLIAGGAGILKTDRYIDYRRPGIKRRVVDYDNDAGVPYNQFLVTLLQGFGLTPAEYEQEKTGFGDYREIAWSKLYDLSDSAKRSVLSGLLR
jgi:hypothetical protein